MDMAYPIARYIITPIYRLWIRKIGGLQNIPKGKPFIIAANHTSYFDALLLPSIIGPRVNKSVHALANSFYWKPLLTRFFLNLWEALPVYVGNEKGAKRKNQQSLEMALKYIQKNELLMVFPEGTRSPDGKLKKAYTGIARLALNSKAPVLPCGIIGSNRVLPKGASFPRFARCEVKIGKLMYFNHKSKNEKTYERVTIKIMKEIAKLINQKYSY
ncbi:1-acyl-sn-glycerol-3-phosphate acyltransferase [Candidatus Woesearchaeota archaeon]|nr:1-acyl-sn-glycerol-3-phosphate acyltransferase [Candidatus Woesearchaeota archaeon]